MLYGNEEERSYVKRFFEHSQSAEKPLFILLLGVEGIGKATFLLEYARSLLGEYVQSDLLRVRDCSRELGKKHALQVEQPTTQKTIELADGSVYENRGIREINARLQQSSFSGQKILFIENLERMTGAAMNAFLKTCEEPLSQRFIFASVSDEVGILPTILSRALLVRFKPLLDADMQQFLRERLHDEKLLRLVQDMSAGRPWIAQMLIDKINEKSDFKLFLTEQLDGFFDVSGRLTRLEILKMMAAEGLLEVFIDYCLLRAGKEENQQLVQHWMQVKKMENANISEENLMWYAVLF